MPSCDLMWQVGASIVLSRRKFAWLLMGKLQARRSKTNGPLSRPPVILCLNSSGVMCLYVGPAGYTLPLVVHKLIEAVLFPAFAVLVRPSHLAVPPINGSYFRVHMKLKRPWFTLCCRPCVTVPTPASCRAAATSVSANQSLNAYSILSFPQSHKDRSYVWPCLRRGLGAPAGALAGA